MYVRVRVLHHTPAESPASLIQWAESVGREDGIHWIRDTHLGFATPQALRGRTKRPKDIMSPHIKHKRRFLEVFRATVGHSGGRADTKQKMEGEEEEEEEGGDG